MSAGVRIAGAARCSPSATGAGTSVQLIFVDLPPAGVAGMRTRQSEDREVEVPRADLSAILVEQAARCG